MDWSCTFICDVILNALVTGGLGFIGRYVCKELTNQRHKVSIFDFVRPESELHTSVPIIVGDVRQLSSMIDALRSSKANVIVHCAAKLRAESQTNPVASLGVNVKGTLNVLEAARIVGISRIIYMSSSTVYGITSPEEIVNEDHPKEPISLYGAQKLFCEHLGETYWKNYGITFVALRLPVVYGPGQRGASPFKEIIEKPFSGEEVVIESGLDQIYNAAYVKDVGRAAFEACVASHLVHGAFNISSGERLRLQDLVVEVKKHFPGATVRIGPGPDPADLVEGQLTIRRANEELQYSPHYPIDLAVSDYVHAISTGSNSSVSQQATSGT
jgi:UDP-glucose 4-epimerase